MLDRKDELIAAAEEALLHTYNRYPVVLDHGEGVYLYDTDGKRYLDFGAGIAVNALGYGDTRYTEALKAQIDKLMHTSNYFYHAPLTEAAKKLTQCARMAKVFFTNSGAEAVEGALKAARRYAYTKGQTQKTKIIAFERAFHGRTFGALSVTGTTSYRTPFEPLVGNVAFATYNDLESVKALMDDTTCAVIVEPVQGEGGIIPAEKSFLQGLRALCDAKDALLIFDEIQCGMGRTGAMFAKDLYDVTPDILTLAKGIGAGFPVGAFLVAERLSDKTLVAGDHGSTYGGNPLAMCAVNKVLDLFEEDHIIEHVNFVASYLADALGRLAERFPKEIKDVRGVGLMRGIALKKPAGDVIGRALENGLILMSAGTDVIRLVPPLVIEKTHVDEMCAILSDAL